MDNEYFFEKVTDRIVEAALDQQFPNSRHHELVEHQGSHYQKHFEPQYKHGSTPRPCGKLGGGKVREWQYHWQIRRHFSELTSIESKLNHCFPGARSNQEVVFEGKRYRKKFEPIFSRSRKTIHRWESYWQELGSVNADQ